MTRLSRQNFGVSRLWRPKPGISRLSQPKRRWRDQNIATHIWYVQNLATKSCLFQTLATKTWHFQTFATVVKAARLSRSEWRRCDFPDQGGDGLIFQTITETARPRINSSRPRRRRRNPEAAQTKAQTARLFRLWQRRRNFPDRG